MIDYVYLIPFANFLDWLIDSFTDDSFWLVVVIYFIFFVIFFWLIVIFWLYFLVFNWLEDNLYLLKFYFKIIFINKEILAVKQRLKISSNNFYTEKSSFKKIKCLKKTRFCKKKI